MADIKTTYIGIDIDNPIVVAACSLSGNLDIVKRIEEMGAGTVIVKSLFEEQIRYKAGTLDTMPSDRGGSMSDSLSFLPRLQHAGPKDHLLWVEQACKAVAMPIIGSLNAVNPDTWSDYARQLEGTGVKGLELNVYSVEADPKVDGATIEQRLIDVVGAVRSQTTLPFAVKLSPFYTSVANVCAKLEAAGANGVVLFNRFFQPDINPDTQTLFNRMTWSARDEMRVPLRWIALLYGTTEMDLIANTGVQEPKDVVRYLLAGAQAVQVAGVLYRKKLDYIKELVSGLDAWMTDKGYAFLSDVRGRLSRQVAIGNKATFERAQYFDFLLNTGGDSATAG